MLVPAAAAVPGHGLGEMPPPPPNLAAVLEAFLGAPGMGLELRTAVDLPRGSGRVKQTLPATSFNAFEPFFIDSNSVL